jgi:hypothetical protein
MIPARGFGIHSKVPRYHFQLVLEINSAKGGPKHDNGGGAISDFQSAF